MHHVYPLPVTYTRERILGLTSTGYTRCTVEQMSAPLVESVAPPHPERARGEAPSEATPNARAHVPTGPGCRRRGRGPRLRQRSLIREYGSLATTRARGRAVVHSVVHRWWRNAGKRGRVTVTVPHPQARVRGLCSPTLAGCASCATRAARHRPRSRGWPRGSRRVRLAVRGTPERRNDGELLQAGLRTFL